MTCSKVKFATQTAAEFYVKKLKDTSIRKTIPQRAYLCQNCACWHLTSQEKKKGEIEKANDKIRKYKELVAGQNNTITKLKKEINELRFNFNTLMNAQNKKT